MSETRWCSHCREELTASWDEDGSCLWCGNPTRKKAASRPNRRGGRYTEDELRYLHKLHVEGKSVRALAKRTYKRLGYASYESAEKTIRLEWVRRGWWVRSAREATSMRCFKHGRSRMPGEYRWRRHVYNGIPYRPLCKAKTKSGSNCKRRSMRGSEFCPTHDPVKGKQLEEHLARGRQSRKILAEQVPTGPFAKWLEEKHGEVGAWDKLADLLGVHKRNLHRYRRGRETMARKTIESYLEIDPDTSFSDLYPGSLRTDQKGSTE